MIFIHCAIQLSTFSDITSIKQIKDSLPSTIDYGKLTFVLNLLEITYGEEIDSSSQLIEHGRKSTPESVRYIRSFILYFITNYCSFTSTCLQSLMLTKLLYETLRKSKATLFFSFTGLFRVCFIEQSGLQVCYNE